MSPRESLHNRGSARERGEEAARTPHSAASRRGIAWSTIQCKSNSRAQRRTMALSVSVGNVSGYGQSPPVTSLA